MTDPRLITDRVRDLYSWAYAWRVDDGDGDTDLSGLRARQAAEFDAWLEAHDTEIIAAERAIAGARQRDLTDAIREVLGLINSPGPRATEILTKALEVSGGE